MNSRSTAFLATLLGSVALASPALAEGSAEAGATVFKKCATCHALEAGKNKVGPSLHQIIGRTPGTVEGYKYSKAMTEFGANAVWDKATLASYLADPRGVVKGTKMAFAGLKKEQDVADVIAYLKSAGE